MNTANMNKPNFKNRTLWTGDNLEIMRGMNPGTVDLIYLDPPFNSKKDYAAPIGSKAAGAAFQDTWSLDDVKREWVEDIEADNTATWSAITAAGFTNGESAQAYLTYMAIRLIEMRRILKETGSIYLHCDPTMSHYLKLMMDAVFGARQFRNEIVWCYRGGGVPKLDFARKHDILLRYSKTVQRTFNIDDVRTAYSEESSERLKYTARAFRGSKTYDNYEKNPKGKHPEDWWSLQPIMPSSGERLGYPTQKPLAPPSKPVPIPAIWFWILSVVVLTCVAAEILGRQWAGIDIEPKAPCSFQVRAVQRHAS